MKRFLMCASAVAVLFSGMTTLSHAEDAAGVTSIAVVDVRSLLTNSKAAKSIQGQIKSHREKFVKNLAEEEKELRGMEKKLIESKDKASPEEFGKKRQAFEEKLLSTRKKAEERRRGLEKGAAQATGKLRKEITDIVQSIADAKGYDLVLSSQNVVVGANKLNISKEVMDKLNSKVSKISVKVK